MNLLSRRSVLAIAAVVDVALHSRSTPVHAGTLAARHKLPPRHLETLLQGLVHAKILKGVRGPRGGYELAREHRRITVGEIVRTAMSLSTADPEDLDANSVLLERVIDPAVRRAGETFLGRQRNTILKRAIYDNKSTNCFAIATYLLRVLPLGDLWGKHSCRSWTHHEGLAPRRSFGRLRNAFEQHWRDFVSGYPVWWTRDHHRSPLMLIIA